MSNDMFIRCIYQMLALLKTTPKADYPYYKERGSTTVSNVNVKAFELFQLAFVNNPHGIPFPATSAPGTKGPYARAAKYKAFIADVCMLIDLRP